MYRFSVKHRGRLSKKASAVQHIGYILRATEGEVAAHVEYMLRVSERTRGREDLLAHGAGNVPSWAHGDAMRFWAEAERYERANGRTATTWEISLPREMPRSAQLAAVEDFLESQFGTRHVYVWAMHENRLRDGSRNPHIHVAFSSRTLDGIERGPAQFFRRYNPVTPEHGGAQKAPALQTRAIVSRQRAAWAVIVNWHCEQARSATRIDARSLAAQGSDREPTQRIPVKEMAAAKYHGTTSEALWKRWTTRVQRAAEQVADRERAQRFWEEQKAHLGITRRTTRAEMRAMVAAATYQTPLYQEHVKYQEEIARLEAQAQALQDALDGKQVPIGRLVAALAASQEEGPRRGLQVHLYAKEDSYGR